MEKPTDSGRGCDGGGGDRGDRGGWSASAGDAGVEALSLLVAGVLGAIDMQLILSVDHEAVLAELLNRGLDSHFQGILGMICRI